VVARDGIEPPTPAFSGPRSTTELSGLGMQTLCRGSPRTTVRIDLHRSTPVAPASSGEHATGGEPVTQTQTKYSNLASLRQPAPARAILSHIKIIRTPYAPSHPQPLCCTPPLPRYCRNRATPCKKRRPCSPASCNRTRAARHPRLQCCEGEPAPTHSAPLPDAEGRRPPHASLGRRLRRDLHQGWCSRHSLRQPRHVQLLQTRSNHAQPSPTARLRRRQSPRGERLQRPASLRRPHRLLLDAQLRPQHWHQRARPLLRYLRPFRQHRPLSHRRVARRGSHSCR